MSTTDVVRLISRLQARGYMVRASWDFAGGRLRWNVVASRLHYRG